MESERATYAEVKEMLKQTIVIAIAKGSDNGVEPA
jgi:hypothetical protein